MRGKLLSFSTLGVHRNEFRTEVNWKLFKNLFTLYYENYFSVSFISMIFWSLVPGLLEIWYIYSIFQPLFDLNLILSFEKCNPKPNWMDLIKLLRMSCRELKTKDSYLIEGSPGFALSTIPQADAPLTLLVHASSPPLWSRIFSWLSR